MSNYWRKTKDWSGEVIGDDRIAGRMRRIKDKSYDKYVNLYMDGTGLIELPVEIYKFEKLEMLWITGNKLTTLPEEITWLIHLQNLRLDRNRFETLPSCIGRLPRLQHLGCNQNRLKTLPIELCNLKNLESLYLAENPDLPEEWAQDFRTKEETQAFLAMLSIDLKAKALAKDAKAGATGAPTTTSAPTTTAATVETPSETPSEPVNDDEPVIETIDDKDEMD